MKNIYKGLLMSSAMVGAAISVSSKANADQVTVKRGDTLSQIANKAGTTVESLKINNNLQDVNKIYPGQELKVDGNVQTSSKTYTVKAGDSLWKIAQANGLSVDELKSANNLTSNLILVGQVLNLEKGQSKTTRKLKCKHKAMHKITHKVLHKHKLKHHISKCNKHNNKFKIVKTCTTGKLSKVLIMCKLVLTLAIHLMYQAQTKPLKHGLLNVNLAITTTQETVNTSVSTNFHLHI